jgi:hypothetical protein
MQESGPPPLRSASCAVILEISDIEVGFSSAVIEEVFGGRAGNVPRVLVSKIMIHVC